MRPMEERRYYGLDALRGAMMMLGIVVHAAAMYMAAPPPHVPILASPPTSYAMDLVVDFVHSFRMPVFFVLAGFFAALLVEKRGLWGTYRNRAARILAPFVAGMVTVMPLSLLFMADFIIALRYGSHRILPERADLERLARDAQALGAPEGIFLAHLWFLYYLLYFYLLAPACRFLGERVGGSMRARRVLASPAGLAMLSLVTAATLWPFPGAKVFGEFLFLKPYVPGLLYYGFFFVCGYLLHFQRPFLGELAARVPRHALMAAALFPLAITLSHFEYAAGAAPAGLRVATVLAHALCTWTFVFLFVGCAQRWFDRESPWALYASQSAYWVFLVHMPVVAFLTWWLVPYELPAIANFAVIVVVTTLVCFVSYHYLVQSSWVSVFLNGKRFRLDWPWRATPGFRRAPAAGPRAAPPEGPA